MSDTFSNILKKNGEGTPEYQIPIGGCWKCLESGKTFEVHNPATGEIIGLVPDCSAADVKSAVLAAKKMLLGDGYSPLQRVAVMEKARELVLEHKNNLAEIITKESGKPISLSLGEVDATAERLKLIREEIRVLYGEYIPGEWVEDTRNKFAIVLRKPLGIVAAISPFNYPLFIAASKIIPALLAGNTVVAKPASATPLSLIYFVCILEEAGLQGGAVNIVTGRGSSIGDEIITSPDIAAISFTGSTPVGESIASKAGIKRLHLELGGKASAIVLEDANLKNAAVQICKGAFRNSGQRCDAVSRVLVQEEVRNDFIAMVQEETKKYSPGDPLDPKTTIGTVISDEAVNRINRLVEDARQKGAELLTGGNPQGLFYPPTILNKVTPEMNVAWEETFGPVMPIISVKDTAEAIALSNQSEYGLDSCVFTENINHAIKISKELQDGSVTINAAPAHGVGHFPFGGNKKSGLGREGLKYSIDELTKLHTIIFSETG